MTVALPARRGARPRTTRATPHRQLDQQASGAIAELLAERMFSRFPGVHPEPSGISVPGARALVLDDGVPAGPPQAFVTGREFAHLHPAPDHSLHMTLPVDVARRAADGGWAEPHVEVASGTVPPTVVMVYAPRDDAELGVVLSLLDQSYLFAADRRHVPIEEKP